MRFISQLPGYVRRCAAIVAAIGLCLTFATGCATASTPPIERLEETTQQSLEQQPPQYIPDYPKHDVTVSQDGTIMRVAELSGEEIYNRDPDAANLPPALAIYLGDLSKIRVELPAVTTIDGEQYEGLTTFILSFDEPQEWMFDAYNQAVSGDLVMSEFELENGDRFGNITAYFVSIIEFTLTDEASGSDPVTLIADEDPNVVTNSIIAEAYNKGMSAWELTHGLPEFNLDSEYEYGFQCRTYGLGAGPDVGLVEAQLAQKYRASTASSLVLIRKSRESNPPLEKNDGSVPNRTNTAIKTQDPTSMTRSLRSDGSVFRDAEETGAFVEEYRGISLSTEAPCEIIVK